MEEFKAFHMKRAEEGFTRLDANGDGKVDKTEIEAMRSRFQQMRGGQSGKGGKGGQSGKGTPSGKGARPGGEGGVPSTPGGPGGSEGPDGKGKGPGAPPAE